MKASGADVVLIDPQFAPKVLAKKDAGTMVDLLATTAKTQHVDLFPPLRGDAALAAGRARIPFEAFISPDELHMNDWSYGCLAKLLGGAIAEAATRSTLTAHARYARISGINRARALRRDPRHLKHAAWTWSWPGLSRPSTSLTLARKTGGLLAEAVTEGALASQAEEVRALSTKVAAAAGEPPQGAGETRHGRAAQDKLNGLRRDGNTLRAIGPA